MAAAEFVIITLGQRSFWSLTSTSIDCQDRCSAEVMVWFARSTEVSISLKTDAAIDAAMC